MSTKFSNFKQKIKSKLYKKETKDLHGIKKVWYWTNRFSLLFHMLLSCCIVFGVEWLSRRDFLSTCSFLHLHTMAFIYNAFLVFCSYTIVFLVRRRAFARFMISGFWMFLGTVNGCVLANRVTPFGYTDLKCIPELMAMSNNTNYFTPDQAMLVVTGVGVFLTICILMFVKGPKYQGKRHLIAVPIAMVILVAVGIPITTQAAQNNNVVANYFSNIAQGYESYGFIYGFSCSVIDRGMTKPDNYCQETIQKVMDRVADKTKKTKYSKDNAPNVICVLLESFCDPEEIKFLNTNKDPIPTFHELEKNYSTGYVTVPVVGAGTANSEFEVLTGMSMNFFGTGEYPYKTILKKTDCESVAADLHTIGYGTHVVHNNGGNFYSRVNAFSMMGFDSFTSKEHMQIKQMTPNGSWATDDVLVGETMKVMDSTVNQTDFTYVITVGTHGDYPTKPVIENPPFEAVGLEDEEKTNQWTYYVNQLNEVDTFMKSLIEELEKRDEDTMVVFFGDHLPTLGLENSDMKSNDIYKTKYVTWNNFGLKKHDADLYLYQLMASTLNDAGIHEGTIMNYHQTQMKRKNNDEYKKGLELLQYDILYGKRYAYNGEDKYPASDIVMGVDDVEITSIRKSCAGVKAVLNGHNFTKWSKVYVNGEFVKTQFINNHMLTIRLDDIEDGDEVVVNILGSGATIFRSSNTVIYSDPDVIEETESPEESAAATAEATSEAE
ncbi:MAG: LTA synthase family protein [Lachnospiraceae bacterium]|nr:LTA synthase family protein [Lachnospiraceae bacterium]